MLRCEDCGTESEMPTGWVAVALDEPGRAVPMLLIYCPDCAAQFEDEDVTLLDSTDA